MTHPHRLFLPALALSLIVSAAWSQPLKRTRSLMTGVSGAFRSAQSGNWSDVSTWEYWNASAWVAATWTPSETDKTIEIQAGHTVNVTQSVTVNEVVIDSDGQVTIKSTATLTVSDTAGTTDLVINGKLLNQGTFSTGTGATWALNSGAWFIQNTTSAIASALDDATIDPASYFEYLDAGGVPPVAGRTYGNLRLTTAGTKAYTNSGSSALTVNGSLLIWQGVTWNTGGFSGNITVHGNATVGGTWTGSGTGNQGTHTFYGTFSVSSTGTYSLATTGGTQGDIHFESDLYNDGAFTTPSNRFVYFNSEGSLTIDGTSPIVFGNGFTSYCGLTIASGATIQVASGKIASVQSNLTVDSGASVNGPGTLHYEAPGQTCTNNGTVSAPTFFGTEGNMYLEGNGTWSNLTVSDPIHVYLGNHVTLTNSSITLNSTLSTQDYEFVLDGCGLVINSGGGLDGGGMTVKMQGTSSIIQDGTFNETLEILSGTTTASGTNGFDGEVVVENGGTLTVPSGDSLRALNNVSVNTGGTINGSGTFYYAGSGSSTYSFTNNGTVGAPTVFEEIALGDDYSVIAGTGVWSDLTFASGAQVHLTDNVTLTNSNITNHGSLSIYSYAFTLAGGSFTNASDGHVQGGAESFETEGTVTIVQNGTFDESLDVVSGTTTTSGEFLQPIIVKPNGTLNIPASTTLTATGDMTVEYTGGEYKVAPTSPKGKPVELPRTTTSSAGTISGGGTLVFYGNAKTFTNDGVVNVTTIFEDYDGDVKSITSSHGGFWKSLTIAASCSTSVSGGHTFTGGGTPFVVDGSVTLNTGSTIVYGGTTAQTVTPLLYDNLEIANSSSDVALGGAVTVDGDLTISSHNLTTDPYTLTLGGSATITETAPYSVIGTLTTTRTLSTGNETLGGMGAEINASGASPGSTIVTRVTGTAPSAPSGIPIKRYFDISPATNTGLAATFVFHYADGELNGNSEADISLYKSTDAGTSWTSEGGTVNTSLNTITLSGVDGFSRWTAAGTGNPAPTLVNIFPTVADLGATLDVTVNGSGFVSGVTTASFGSGVSVTSTTVNSSTSMKATIAISRTTPVGDRDVTVSNAAPGGGSATLSNAFSVVYPSPLLASIAPNTASRGQTLNVALTGEGFYSGATTVSFGADVAVNSMVTSGTTTLTANITIAPEAATGERDVTVSTAGPGGGTTTLGNAFTIGNPDPTVAGASPDAAARGEKVAVVLTGTNFLAGVSTVSFGSGITVDSMTFNSGTQITAHITVDISAAAGTRDISITNAAPGGGTAMLSGAFSVNNPAPTLASITPASGARGQTLDVTVTGTNFLAGVTTCSYGDGITVNSVSSVAPTQVTANVTIDMATTPGPRDITASNAAPGGGSAILAGAFTVTNPSPTVASVSPNGAGRGSQINVVVSGTNFLNGVSSVSFGPDITVNSVTVTSETEISLNLTVGTSAATGARSVTVTNAAPGGGTATLTSGFTVDTSPATGIENSMSAMPEEYVLHEAYPNPFNPSTKIRYGLPERSRVKLEVYNMLGNIVAVLVDGERSKGYYEVEWVAGNLPSGVYLIRLHSESLESSKRLLASRKVVLVK